jgi:DUF1680 family protein
MKNYLILLITFLLAGCSTGKNKEIAKDMAFKSVKPVKESFIPVAFGEIKPSGWIKAQMEQDMAGFTGNLDKLVPDLMHDSIYGSQRLTKKVKTKNVGNITDAFDVQYLWWNSETQSNWRDGYLRNAILLDDKIHLAEADKYIKYILSTQDEDGYLGIYAKDLRYNFNDENGELWAKTTLLRGMIAWYESSKDSTVYKSIIRAVDDVMKKWPEGKSSPFHSDKPAVGGLTHGLLFTDVLDRLHQLTGERKYIDYALFLYKDFSMNVLNEDAQYKKIIDTAYKLKEHGVHSYEHLRPLTLAYFTSGNKALENALEVYLKRISDETNPSGGPAGDEWIGEKRANSTETGYEYCSIHELMTGYLNLFQKTGDPRYGDLAENIFYNAAQGSRLPGKSAIAYLKTDNSFIMDGNKNGLAEANKKQTRYKYSPVHQDVAVCCVPNAGRITPYFVSSMWFRDDSGLVASLIGPNVIATSINNNKVIIREETNYPYENSVVFRISMEKPFDFSIKIRKPSWVKDFRLNCKFRELGQFIVIDKKWQAEDSIALNFNPELSVKKDLNGEKYFTSGALVFAVPIESTEKVTKKYPLPGFFDYSYFPVKKTEYRFIAGKSEEVKLMYNKAGIKVPALETTLLNTATGKPEKMTLVPIAKTILRQVTFK